MSVSGQEPAILAPNRRTKGRRLTGWASLNWGGYGGSSDQESGQDVESDHDGRVGREERDEYGATDQCCCSLLGLNRVAFIPQYTSKRNEFNRWPELRVGRGQGPNSNVAGMEQPRTPNPCPPNFAVAWSH